MHARGVPTALVDVVGDGNCLYYCLLQFLVFQQKKFTEKWGIKITPVIWIRKKIKKWVEELTNQDWLDVTMCDEQEFRKVERNCIFSEGVDYLDGEMMRNTDAHFGDPIDALAFAKRYVIVVVIYACDANINQCSTLVFDGRPDHTTVKHHPGICPDIVPVTTNVLELVRYTTDLPDKKRKNMPLFKGVAKGTSHFVFVNRGSHAPVNKATMLTRAQERAGLTAGGDPSATDNGDGDNSSPKDGTGGTPPVDESAAAGGTDGGGDDNGNGDDKDDKPDNKGDDKDPKGEEDNDEKEE
jgi:hypothetical protein